MKGKWGIVGLLVLVLGLGFAMATDNPLVTTRKPVAIAVGWNGQPVVWLDANGDLHGHLVRRWFGWQAIAKTRALTTEEVAARLKEEAGPSTAQVPASKK